MKLLKIFPENVFIIKTIITLGLIMITLNTQRKKYFLIKTARLTKLFTDYAAAHEARNATNTLLKNLNCYYFYNV